VSQQLTVSKKPRLGPKICSQAWWIDRIKRVEGPKYLQYWTHYSDFEIGQFRALAAHDYFVLGEGIETQGAPDFGLNLDYPIKLVGKPFWVNISTLVYKDYRLWTWIQVAKTLERPLSDQTITWFNYFSIESNQVEAKEFLAPFRKENQKKFDIYLEWEHDGVYPNTNPISTIEFDPPRGALCRDLSINHTLQDSRFIPITEEGLVIRTKFLKYYLEQSLWEYLALGGLQELIDRQPLIETGYKLPDPFYWDLWGNIDYCQEEHLNPEDSEEE